jgi:ribonuclease HI
LALNSCEDAAMPRRPRRKGGSLKDGERRQIAYAARRAGTAPKTPAPTGTALVLCDGGSRGNPGPAAIAAVLLAPGGAELERRVEHIGHASAAEAEYRALALGLALAAAHGADPVEVRSDSQLAIAALESGAGHDDVRAAAKRFTDVRWRWHPRAENEIADALVRAELWGQ